MFYGLYNAAKKFNECKMPFNGLTNFWPMFQHYTLWKHAKANGFLEIWGCKMETIAKKKLLIVFSFMTGSVFASCTKRPGLQAHSNILHVFLVLCYPCNQGARWFFSEQSPCNKNHCNTLFLTVSCLLFNWKIKLTYACYVG